jgi:hypothetical protein
MKSFLELANDRPQLSKKDLDCLEHHTGKDRALLKKVHLDGMEKMENWGIP